MQTHCSFFIYMIIKDTYISNLKNVWNKEDIFLIITRYPPKYEFKEDNIFIIKDLSPNENLFYLAKNKMISFEEYKYLYLNQIIKNKIDEYLNKRIKLFNKNIWLLCYCKENTFCHRKILAELMEEKFNYEYDRNGE